MKKTLAFGTVAFILAHTSSAVADGNWFLGAQYKDLDTNFHGEKMHSAGLIAGYQFNPFLALESRLAMGTSGYSSHYGAPEDPRGRYSQDIDSQASFLLKASYPIFSRLGIYGLAGYSQSKVTYIGLNNIVNQTDGNTTSEAPFNLTETARGFSYGVGLDYRAHRNISIFLDYQLLPSNGNSQGWDSSTLGVIYHF